MNHSALLVCEIWESSPESQTWVQLPVLSNTSLLSTLYIRRVLHILCTVHLRKCSMLLSGVLRPCECPSSKWIAGFSYCPTWFTLKLTYPQQIFCLNLLPAVIGAGKSVRWYALLCEIQSSKGDDIGYKVIVGYCQYWKHFMELIIW